MRRRRYGAIGIGASALMTVALLTGCSGASAGGSTSTAAAGGSNGGPKATVSIWSWTPVEATMKKVVAAIEKKYPNITIETNISPHADYNTAIQAAASSGSLPDIMGLPPGSQTQQYRTDLQPIDPIAKKLWGADWKSNFPQSAITQAALGNPSGNTNLYIVPQETEVITMWYNKPAFKAAGITSVPKSLDQLVSDAKKLKSAGYIPFYQGAAADNFNGWLFGQIAGQTDMKDLQAAQNGQATWTAPGMVKAAKIWSQLFSDGVFQDGAVSAQQYPTGANLFAAGRVGMIMLGSWWLQEAALDTSPQGLKTMADYGQFSFPAVTAGGSPTPPLGGIDFGWGVTKNAAKSASVQQATNIVLKELVSGVGEQIMVNDLNDLPAFKGFKPQTKYSSDVMKLYNGFLDEVQKAQGHLIGNPTVATTLSTSLQSLALGKTTPAAAMATVQASVPKS
jgi:raffinose/stachyose/melibiose transport system substrate-binding protein